MIDVPPHDLADLRDRLRATRWPDPWPQQGWDAGTDQRELRRLVALWADGYDWPAQQAEIAALPWHDVDLDGTPLRYLRFDPEPAGPASGAVDGDPSPLPVLLVNGWPSTAIELVPLARRLAAPAGAGPGRPVIAPALPGFPLSPQRPRHTDLTHDLMHRLLREELGIDRYLAHGGDLGAGITSRLAEAHPDEVAGLHLLAVAAPVDVDPADLGPEERRHMAALEEWMAAEGGYQHLHRTRPLSLAPALSDSPAGLLAWILEKYRSWSDSGGDLSTRFSDDFLLTQASLYWFSGAIGTSLRAYWEPAVGFTTPVRRVEVPTAVALFPHDLAHPPRSWAERTYDVVRWTEMPRGGHFAPWEEPDLLAADIRAFATEIEAPTG